MNILLLAIIVYFVISDVKNENFTMLVNYILALIMLLFTSGTLLALSKSCK